MGTRQRSTQAPLDRDTMKRPVDDDDEAEGWNLPQKKKVKFQEGEDDEADEPYAGRLHDDEDDDEPIKRGKGGGMAGNDDEVSVKVQSGRIKHMEGEEQASFGDDYEEGGIKIVPFNLASDRETGHFDESGNYIDAQFEGQRDAWMDELDEAEDELKKQLKEKGSTKKVKQVEIADFDEEEEIDMLKLKRAIVDILLPKEKVSKALKRLRGSGKKPSAEGAADFNTIMEAANNLLQCGEFGVYDKNRETLEDDLSAAEKESDEGLWDYKLAEDGDEHGPFTTAQMAAWSEQGYFSTESPALVRMRDPKLPIDSIPFRPSTEVDFAAYADLMDL